MLYIEKGDSPIEMRHRVAEIKSSPIWRKIPAADTDTIRKEGFDKLPKDEIRQNLLDEQHYLCAYCMKRIENDGLHTTIEHIIPLSEDKEKSLDYYNMAAVCKGGADIKNANPRICCCDHSKGDESKMLLSPYNKDMMDNIRYYKNGVVYFHKATNYNEEQMTQIIKDINDILKLNGIFKDGEVKCDTATMLVKGRKDAVAQAEKIIETLKRKKHYTSASVNKEIRRILSADKREEFAGVIVFFLHREYKKLLSQNK